MINNLKDLFLSKTNIINEDMLKSISAQIRLSEKRQRSVGQKNMSSAESKEKDQEKSQDKKAKIKIENEQIIGGYIGFKKYSNENSIKLLKKDRKILKLKKERNNDKFKDLLSPNDKTKYNECIVNFDNQNDENKKDNYKLENDIQKIKDILSKGEKNIFMERMKKQGYTNKNKRAVLKNKYDKNDYIFNNSMMKTNNKNNLHHKSLDNQLIIK